MTLMLQTSRLYPTFSVSYIIIKNLSHPDRDTSIIEDQPISVPTSFHFLVFLIFQLAAHVAGQHLPVLCAPSHQPWRNRLHSLRQPRRNRQPLLTTATRSQLLRNYAHLEVYKRHNRHAKFVIKTDKHAQQISPEGD